MQGYAGNFEIRSAGDIMRQMGSPQKPVDYVTGKVIDRKKLSGATKYSYCPYCYQRVKRGGGDYKTELAPLQSVTYKNIYLADKSNGDSVVIFEKELECTVCREPNGQPKKITLDDFSKVYSEPYKDDESNALNLYDTNALKKAGFTEFADNVDVRSVIDNITQNMRKRANFYQHGA